MITTEIDDDVQETKALEGYPWDRFGADITGLGKDQIGEILTRCKLDWRVEKHETFVNLTGPDGQPVAIPTKNFVLIRQKDNKILTDATASWRPTQNEDAIDYFLHFSGVVGAKPHWAGTYVNGLTEKNQSETYIYLIADLPEYDFTVTTMPVKNGKKALTDRWTAHILFSMTHVYGKKMTARPMLIRKASKSTIILDGTSKIDARADQYPLEASIIKDFGEFKTLFKSAAIRFEALASSRITVERNIREFLKEIFPSTDKGGMLSRQGQQALNAIDEMPGSDRLSNTWLSALAAVSYVHDHVVGYQANTRMASSWHGDGGKRKAAALKVIMKHATASKEEKEEAAPAPAAQSVPKPASKKDKKAA